MGIKNNRIFALLVGINDYPSSVGKLKGCINDIDNFEIWLRKACPKTLRLEHLKNSDATRGNIIQMFRKHLSQAGPSDTVVFHYSGHGARTKSAEVFKRFYPDGKDEGLVCFDSREKDGFDLSDKELAILLAEIARNQPHIAVLLDCCHSGSGTRGADDFTQARARVTHEILEERPLETYLDGYYATSMAKKGFLEIPASSHIVIAACERVQKAWEGKDNHGVFSKTLLEVLNHAPTNLTYADLFLRTRAAVLRYVDNQTPQFETFLGFNAYDGFLGRAASNANRRYSVYFDLGNWKVNCGALHGLPTDLDKAVELVLYPEFDDSKVTGNAKIIQIGPQESTLQLLNLDSNTADRYQAEITNLPISPLLIQLDGDEAGMRFLQNTFSEDPDKSWGFVFSTEPNSILRYFLEAHKGRYSLRERDTNRLIQGAESYTTAATTYMFSILKHIAAWERACKLQNKITCMNTESVTFKFIEILHNNDEYIYPDNEITLDITKENDIWRNINGKFCVDNRSGQTLHFALAYFSNDFGIQIPYNERIDPTNGLFELVIAGQATFTMKLEEEEGDEAIHIFKLIVSTERIDDFVLKQNSIGIGEIVNFRTEGARSGGSKGVTFGHNFNKLAHQNEWFTKTIRVRLVRQQARINHHDVRIINTGITIKGHPRFNADISLSAASSASRGVGVASDFYRALELQGIELLNFTSTRGDTQAILELSDIQNWEALREQPLEIELDVNLDNNEYIIPATFDGEHILLAGETEKNSNGCFLIRIDHVPDGVPDQRRSLGKALKLYFFKAYLKKTNVNKLCWVEYKADGSVERHEEKVASKIAAASNILLLIHGIIGDTEVMALSLPLAIDTNDIDLKSKFDLILTYDYENLSTSIEDTARQLRKQLNECGFSDQDNKRLTLLVHSMGGLVARWFIEQEGGNQFVDHLVMCGTPNVGSPFGKIDSARNLTSIFTTWAMNSYPAFVPFGAGLLTMLGRSKKISNCLEQMNPNSSFIQTLNNGCDPHLPYTILAGNIADYNEQYDSLMAKLTAKIGKGNIFDILFEGTGHDIAVSLPSIHGILGRQPLPTKQVIGCHHLNYFTSKAGLEALASITRKSI